VSAYVSATRCAIPHLQLYRPFARAPKYFKEKRTHVRLNLSISGTEYMRIGDTGMREERTET